MQLSELPKNKIFSIRGIGDAIGKKIIELLHTGKLNSLEELLEKTPPGVLEMLQIKGIGPKKIYAIWKEMEIENIGELLYACHENRLLYTTALEKKHRIMLLSQLNSMSNSKAIICSPPLKLW